MFLLLTFNMYLLIGKSAEIFQVYFHLLTEYENYRQVPEA